MKTQINKLQRGNHTLNIVGSKHSERMEIAAKVKHENPKRITVRYQGLEITLYYNESTTGKTWAYTSKHLDTEAVKTLFPYDTKAINEPERAAYTMTITSMMFVRIDAFRKKGSEKTQWKNTSWINIDEAEIEIL